MDDFLEGACATENFMKGNLVTDFRCKGEWEARQNVGDYVVLAIIRFNFVGIFGKA